MAGHDGLDPMEAQRIADAVRSLSQELGIVNTVEFTQAIVSAAPAYTQDSDGSYSIKIGNKPLREYVFKTYGIGGLRSKFGVGVLNIRKSDLKNGYVSAQDVLASRGGIAIDQLGR